MTSAALLKKVKELYPEAFDELSKKKLRLLESAILYASKFALSKDVLTEDQHQKLLSKITGKKVLSAGDKLKAYRMREDLTQEQLAKKAKIPQANISAMEAGKRAIGIHSAKKLAEILNCNFRQLV